MTLPPSVGLKAKLCILDTVGCAFAGSSMDEGRSYARLYESMEGVQQATILGRQRRAPAIHAANVNSYLANLSDFDDNFELPPGITIAHPGAVVVPAVLALGERDKVPGQVALAATVVGYEISIRIAEALFPTLASRTLVWGWATYQVFGAAASAAVMRALGVASVLNTLGLTAAYAPVPFIRKIGFDERPVASLKNHYGWATEGGMTAVALAESGFVASHTIFDGETGFWRMAGSDRYDPDRLTEHLGQSYKIDDVRFKSYAYCRNLHPALLALDRLLVEGPVNLNQIQRICVRSAAKLVDYLCYDPMSVLDAQFSLPHAVAARLVQGATNGRVIGADELMKPAVQRLRQQVVLEVDPSLTVRHDLGSIETEIHFDMANGTTRSGRANSEEVMDASNEDLVDRITAKFVRQVSPLLGDTASARVIDMVMHLDALPNLDELTSALTMRVSEAEGSRD